MLHPFYTHAIPTSHPCYNAETQFYTRQTRSTHIHIQPRYWLVRSSLQCTLYSVECTHYSLQCTLYSVQCTLYSYQESCSSVTPALGPLSLSPPTMYTLWAPSCSLDRDVASSPHSLTRDLSPHSLDRDVSWSSLGCDFTTWYEADA